MSRSDKQGFWTAVTLHVIAVVGLLIPILLQAILPKKQVHVFELVSPPSEAGQQVSDVQPVDLPPQPLDLPEMPAMPDIPDPVPPPPEPRPQPPEAQAPPALVNYDDFRRDNPLREPRQQRVQQRRPVEIERIDTSKIHEQLRELTRKSPDREKVERMSPELQNAILQYGHRIKARLNAAWDKPPGLSGRQFICDVVFEVSRNGTIRNIRMQPSSGNAAFDASVMAAFSKFVPIGPTPSGDSHTFTISFKMVE